MKISVLNEVIKQMEEDEELKLNAVQIKYEKKLQSEKEINLNLKGKTDDVKHEVTFLKISCSEFKHPEFGSLDPSLHFLYSHLKSCLIISPLVVISD